jgi:hypothetical protein
LGQSITEADFKTVKSFFETRLTIDIKSFLSEVNTANDIKELMISF